MAKSKNYKTIVQPDQLEMSFARRLWASSADVGHMGFLAFSVTLAVCGMLAAADDFLLHPALMALALLGVTITTEYVRSMRWTDRKDVFVTTHFLTIIGTLLVLGHLMVSRDTLAQQRASDRAAAAQQKVEESNKAWQERIAEEAKAAEAAKKAEEECKQARLAAIDIATQRKAEAGRELRRCRVEFERDKTIFTTVTMEAHCRTRQGSLGVAIEDLKAANALPCAPASTGSVVPRRD